MIQVDLANGVVYLQVIIYFYLTCLCSSKKKLLGAYLI